MISDIIVCKHFVIRSADAAQQIQQAQMQQQLIALANSPYGDSPLFRDVKLVSDVLYSLIFSC